VDEDLGAGEQRVLVARGNLRGGDLAAEDAFAVVVMGFGQNEQNFPKWAEPGLKSILFILLILSKIHCLNFPRMMAARASWSGACSILPRTSSKKPKTSSSCAWAA